MAPVRVPGEQAGEVLVHGRVVVEQAGGEADGCVGQAVADRLRARPRMTPYPRCSVANATCPYARFVVRPVSRGLSAVAETAEHGERPELQERYGEEFLPFLRRRMT
jgi:hypothetical protein